jgi:hypothetical protein
MLPAGLSRRAKEGPEAGLSLLDSPASSDAPVDEGLPDDERGGGTVELLSRERVGAVEQDATTGPG